MNVIKLLVCVVLSLGLTGCAYQVASSVDIARAQAFCNNKAGIAYLRVDFISTEVVVCGNGQAVNLSSIRLDENLRMIEGGLM